MSRINLNLRTTLICTCIFMTSIFAQGHQMFTQILQKNVRNGLVDYQNLVNDKQFDKYLIQLSETNPDTLSRNGKLAFWINAYNAFTLQIIVENYPIKSINDLNSGGKLLSHLLGTTVWDKEFITIYNEKYSLNDIEHKILRKMSEPRIHFAIVCASISCPELRNVAYEEQKLEIQLQESAINFLRDMERNDFNLSNRTANLSKIFDWFDEDFGDTNSEILIFVSQFLSDSLKINIIENTDKWKISYKDYNWNLNEIK